MCAVQWLISSVTARCYVFQASQSVAHTTWHDIYNPMCVGWCIISPMTALCYCLLEAHFWREPSFSAVLYRALTACRLQETQALNEQLAYYFAASFLFSPVQYANLSPLHNVLETILMGNVHIHPSTCFWGCFLWDKPIWYPEEHKECVAVSISICPWSNPVQVDILTSPHPYCMPWCMSLVNRGWGFAV